MTSLPNSSIRRCPQCQHFTTNDGESICDQCATENSAIVIFYAKVCLRAEAAIETSGTVTGAHFNAMRQLLAERNLLERAEHYAAWLREVGYPP